MNRLQEWAIRHGVSDQAYQELCLLFVSSVPQKDGTDETALNAKLRITAPQYGSLLWRNNSGAMLDKKDRMVRYGLANDSKRLNDVFKSSDLIGITPVQWAGKVFGVFTAVESKRSDWKWSGDAHEMAQHAFLTTVEAYGGIGLFARSIDDYLTRIGRK